MLLTQSDWLLYSEWVPSYLNTPSQKIKKNQPKKFEIKQTHPFYFIDKLSNLLKIEVKLLSGYLKNMLNRRCHFQI